MFDLSRLPERIFRKTAGLTWAPDSTGMSGSTILLFDKMVLKIEKISGSSENEQQLLRWLDGKLPVPKIIETEAQDGYSFLLMSKLPGEMACSKNSLRSIEDTVKALAYGMKMLWEIDISDCPSSNVVSEKLKQAKYRIANNLVSADNFNPETFHSEEFADIPGLYDFLDRNRPKEDFVFSHGDFCLPNVLVSGSEIMGFLDWGRGGVADRWQDIALCVRSLRRNYMEYARCGEGEYQEYRKLLFRELGISADEEKIRYYILLDELF